MYGANIYKGLGADLSVPDPNEVLNRKYLNPVGEIIKGDIANFNGVKLDDEDISNLMNWHSSYKIAYSYPENEHKLSQKWQSIFEKINKDKGKYDLMGLVEIAIGRLLQAEFEKKGYQVRVRKTSNFDDITSGIDYVVEYYNKKGKISEVIGIDFTISERGANSLLKNLKKYSYPEDYKKYYEKKNGKRLKKIPRIVMKLSRDLAYSFTNNFFISVLEEGHLLDNEDIQENFNFALEDIKGLNTGKRAFEVSNVLENIKSKTNRLIDKF